jgi:hypothetical protein
MEILNSVQSSLALIASASIFAFHAFRLVRDLRLAHRARSWPRALCNSLEAKVGQTNSGGVQSFATEVSYSFEVDGKEWTGNRLMFGQQTPMNKAKAEEQTRAVLANQPAYAIYNPDNPSISVLNAKAGIFVSATWSIGLLILVGVFAFAWLS